MRFLTPDLVRIVEAIASMHSCTVEALDVGTDAEMVSIKVPNGGLVLMHNQLPVVDGDGYVVVVKVIPPPKVTEEAPRRRRKANR